MKKESIIFIVFLSICLGFVSCKVRELSFDVSEVVLGLGESKKVQAKMVPDNVKKNVLSYSSGDISIASVDNEGVVFGEGVGETFISATASKGGKTASYKVIVASKIVINADDTVLTVAGKRLSYKYFESEEAFLAKLYAFNRVELSGCSIDEFTIDSVEYDENCVLAFSGLFKKGERLPSSFFGIMQNIDGERGETYNTKFSITISAKGVTIPIVWDDSKGDDSVTIPDAGNFVLISDNFELSNINENDLTLTVSLVGFKTLLRGAYDDNSETGDGTVYIAVKNDGSVILPEQSFPISDLITFNLSGFTKRENSLTFDIRYTLNSGLNPVMSNMAIVNFVFPPKKTYIEKQLTISPISISIARSSSERGVIEGKASAMLNYGGEIEYGLRDLLQNDYRSYDYESAVWGGDIVNVANGAVLAKIQDAPYKRRVSFDFGLDADYSVSLQNGYILVPHTTQEATFLRVKLQWGSDPVWGNSIAIPNKSDYKETIKINDGVVSDSGTSYSLVFGDDFNYHFNGLNYKNVDFYHAIKRKPHIDYEAYRYDMYWDSESDKPYKRHISSWDIRNAEVKNGRLLSKVLATDPQTGTVFLGPNKSKALTGFSDLLPGAYSVSGCTRSKTVRFGYVEARVRVKNKGYNNSVISGPWYAFWLHGDMHEYDIMEYVNGGEEGEQVIHWHNGWGGFGSSPESSWNKFSVPKDWNNEWWTLGLYWDASKVVYSYNGQEFIRLEAKANNSGVTMTAKNNGRIIRGHDKDVSGIATTYNKDLNPEIAGGTTPIPYGSNKLKGIMDVPMNIFFSTEHGNGGWGGIFPLNGYDKLPTWLEVEYVAYYLPEQNISSIKLGNVPAVLKVGDQVALSYTIMPAQTSQRTVSWSSSNEAVAQVSETGMVTIVGFGTTTIKVASVSNPSIFDSVTLTVADKIVNVTKVEVTPANATIGLDDDFQLTAIVLPATATIKTVEWSSSDYAIADVDSTGKVRAFKAGDVIITATSSSNPSVFASANITVEVQPTAVNLDYSSVSISIGRPMTLNAVVEPSSAKQDVIWESSDTTVVSVENGVLTGHKNGIATITAKSEVNNSIKASCLVSVESVDTAPNSIVVDGITADLVKAFNFDNNNDVVLFSSMTISDGVLKVNGSLGNNCNIVFNNVGQVDAMAIRYKYTDCAPNLNIEFGSDPNHYTFYRPGANVSVFSGDWSTRYFDESSFGPKAGTWINQRVLSDGGIIRMTFDDQLKKGNFTKNGEWRNSMNICFRDTNSSTSGYFEVEYVGFYRINKSAPTSVIRSGQEYVLTGLYNFDDANGVTINNSAISSSINNGELVISFPQTKSADASRVTFGPCSEEASYIEIRAKISNTGFAPHLGIETWQNGLIRNTFDGQVNNGFAFRVHGAAQNLEEQRTAFVANEYTTLGYLCSGDSSHSYYQDGVFKVKLTSTLANAPNPSKSFSFYLGQDGNGSGTITLDYVAFYKKN